MSRGPARVAAGIVLASLTLMGCSATTGGTGARSGASGSLTILAASSLKSALDAATVEWVRAHPEVALTISSDSSAALETQIEQGAKADMFLSADTSNPQKLVDAGLADGGLVVFAGNGLAIVVPEGNPARIASPADLSRPGVRIIAAGDAVPITRYATQLVANLAVLPGYRAGFASAYAANVVTKVDTVSAVVAQVELGQGDAGIVYETDAQASTKVATVDIPASANVSATYAGVVVGSSPQRAAARIFLDWLRGPEGQAVLARFGFLPLPTT
jgi:molybdate transport system substrate-binding protein